MKRFLACLCVLAVLPAYATEATEKPGSEIVLAQGKQGFELFVSGFYRDDEVGYSGVSLLWVPEFLRSACMGKTAEECKKIDRCVDFPKDDECQAFRLAGLTRGLGRASNTPAFHKMNIERRVFEIDLYQSYPLPHPQNIAAILRSLKFKDLQGVALALGAISTPAQPRDFAVKLDEKAKLNGWVEWVVFSNGNSFNLISVK